MSIHFPTTKGMLMIIRMYKLITFITVCQLVRSQYETLPKIVGESVTLTCEPSFNVNDNYPMSWYREDRASFVNNDGDRISATCDRGYRKDKCSLIISPLTTDDADVYVCEYYDGVYNLIGGINLTVGYGKLPSDDSPICEIYKGASDGGYIPASEQETFTLGDDIYVRCEVQDSSLMPSLSWIYEQKDSITELTEYVKARRTLHPVSLTENDVGASFICFMKHPAISESRNCSITPLPALTTTPNPGTTTIAIPAKMPAIDPSPASPSTEKANKDNNPGTKANTSNTSQQYTLPIVIALILIIVATVVIILVIVLFKRRKKHGVIPSTLSYELTYERDQPITAEYEAVNALDSIDLGRDLKDAKQYRQENVYATDQNSTATTSTEDASSLYAKPNKGPNVNRKMNKGSCQYENLPRQISFEEHDKGTEGADDGLMYADLELSEFRDSDSARMTPINEDATVYADINGSL